MASLFIFIAAGVQFTVRNPQQYVTIPLSREIGVFLLWNIYMTDKMVEAYLKALENEERAAKLCRIFERRSGHARDDPPLERRSAREKLRAVDHQHLSGSAERILPFLRLGGLLRTVSQDPAPPVSRQQAGANARCSRSRLRPRRTAKQKLRSKAKSARSYRAYQGK